VAHRGEEQRLGPIGRARLGRRLLGGAGAKYVRVEKGVFGFLTDGTINRTHIGKTIFLVDDRTVSATDGAGTRSAAGVLDDFDGNIA